MRRFGRALCLAVMAAVLLGGPAGAQTDQIGDDFVLEGVDSSSFPLVRAVVSGPRVSGELDDAFVVSEDGEEISPDVIRLRGDQLNVVVALDVSGSMVGEPLDRAKAAVAELLTILPESVPVSVVTFSDAANVQSNFTVDRDATLAAVDGLIAAGGTALYDGVTLGLSQLDAQGGTKALVVLADGDDTSSAASLDQTAAALGSADVAASFVGLQTEDFNPDILSSFATASGGEALTVDEAAGFVEAFGTIAEGLGNVYEIRWRSASDGDAADLAIRLAADTSQEVSTTYAHDATTEFVPDVALDTRTVGSAGLLGASWLPLLAALCVTAGGAAVFLMVRNSDAAVERRAERSEEKLQGRALWREEKRTALTDVQDRLNDISAQVLQAKGRGRNLDDTLDRAGLAIRSNEFVVACVAIELAALLVGVLLFGIPFFLLGGLVPIVGIPMTIKFLARRRRKKFVSQLGDTIQLMVGSLTAGYGLGQALDSVARETDSPTAEEFSRVVMETRLGRSLEDALDAMSHRLNAPDFNWVVDAVKIQSSVGGNLSEILEQVGETIRARVRIKRQVDALAAEGKISALVLFILPFGLCGFIGVSNPDYIKPLFSGGIGYVLVGTALTMITIGGLWLKKLVNPEF